MSAYSTVLRLIRGLAQKWPMASAVAKPSGRWIAILAVGAVFIASPAGAVEKLLPVTTRWQETSQWCWAASGEMIMEYIGTSTTPPRETPQCYQANQGFGRTDCCTCPTPAGCVSPGWPQFDTWGYNSTTTAWGTALTWAQVTNEINSGRPFMLSWAWHGGGAHALVGIGYNQRLIIVRKDFLARPTVKKLPPKVVALWPPVRPVLTLNWVLINNPWPPQGRCGSGENASGPFGGDFEIVTYAAFVGGASFDHDHGSDIYSIVHK